jgi:peptidoglycan/LPS O-acetylase OafA/YrhL
MECVHYLLPGVTLSLHCNEVWNALGIRVRDNALSFVSVLSRLGTRCTGTFVLPEQEQERVVELTLDRAAASLTGRLVFLEQFVSYARTFGPWIRDVPATGVVRTTGVIRLMAMTMKDSPNLDLLRSFAVGFVVLAHLQDFVPGWGWGYNMHPMGRMGIALFFVHTMLVLLMSLERHGAAAAPFLIRRFFRIYPLSIFMVLLMAFFGGLGTRPVDLVGMVSNLLLIQNITGYLSSPAPLWTLPYEIQMYLFLPALYAVTRSARPLLWTGLICSGALAMALVAWSASVDLWVFIFVPCFLPGVLAFVLKRRCHARLNPLLLFAGIAIAVPVTTALVNARVPETPLFWAVCLILGITLPMFREITSKPLARCANVIATYSYGIYLTHVLALALAFTAGRAGLVEWGVFCVLMPALAWAAYHGIEKHGIRLGVALASKLTASEPRQIGVAT